MGLIGKGTIPIPNIVNAILSAFIAIMGVRITYPILEPIMGATWKSGFMKAAATLVMWLIYFFVLYVFTWMVLFKPPEAAQQVDGGGQ